MSSNLERNDMSNYGDRVLAFFVINNKLVFSTYDKNGQNLND